MEEDLILAKAELISGGAVRLPKGYRPPVRFSRSTAGPGAGKRSLVFSFSGMRVKKAISDDGEFLYDPSEMTISNPAIIVCRGIVTSLIYPVNIDGDASRSSTAAMQGTADPQMGVRPSSPTPYLLTIMISPESTLHLSGLTHYL